MQDFFHSFQKLEFPKVKEYIQRYALSDLGREQIERLLPSTEISEIEQHLNRVTEMKKLLTEDEPLPFDVLHDIRIGLQRTSIENFVLPPAELHRICVMLKTSRAMRAYFSNRSTQYPLLSSAISGVLVTKVLEFNIDRAIDDEGNVKNSASKELQALRSKIHDRSLFLRKRMEGLLKDLSGKEWAQEEIISTRDGRMVIPVKVEHKNHVPGLIHSASSSGATVFIEPMETLELNNEICTLQFEEQREIERILKELTSQVGEVKDALIANVRILGEFDFIQAKAKYSIETLGNQPFVSSERKLKCVRAYHPILLKKHGRAQVVPLDMEFEGDVKTVVITGPNAGGKSVALKTVGILSLMAQSGCHVPASSETLLPLFTKIFVDMGDEQSIENDLSSFSSHLTNLKSVLEEADEESLVLIDEIGSGTDPIEGSSLAAAFLEQLTEKGSFTIVTTHQGSLKVVAFEHPGMENGAMEFDQQTLTPTYRFRMGVPGSSYALEMAERLSFPANLIARSKNLKGTSSVKMESLIISLESKAQELQHMLDGVNSEKAHLKELVEHYESRIKSLKLEVKQIRSEAIDEAQSILEKANSIIENTVKEIRETNAGKESVSKARREIDTLRRDLAAASVQTAPASREEPVFHVGDYVRLRGTASVGQIEAIADAKSFFLNIGGMRAKVPKEELEHAEREEARSTPEHTSQLTDDIVQREIDIRGMFGEEAVGVIDKFIDGAILHGLRRVDIIHGKGTGSLRKRIGEYLKTNNAVKSFRLGEWNEGGTGVTVVELE